MQKLHLVGFTTDHKSLILSARRGARSGGFTLEVDDAVGAAVQEAIERAAAATAEEPAEAIEPLGPTRPESALSVRELQTRLRSGRTFESVAAEAGVDVEWVTRFAAPVLAEQRRVVEATRNATYSRARLGPSALRLGPSVYRNLAAKGVGLLHEELDRGWSTRQLADGRWVVTFSYVSRGRRQKPSWELDLRTGEVRARDRLAGELAFVPGAPRAASPAAAPNKPALVPASTTTDLDRANARRVAEARKAAEAQLADAVRRGTKRSAEVAQRALSPKAAAERARRRAAAMAAAELAAEELAAVEREAEVLAAEEVAEEEVAAEEEHEVEPVADGPAPAGPTLVTAADLASASGPVDPGVSAVAMVREAAEALLSDFASGRLLDDDGAEVVVDETAMPTWDDVAAPADDTAPDEPPAVPAPVAPSRSLTAATPPPIDTEAGSGGRPRRREEKVVRTPIDLEEIVPKPPRPAPAFRDDLASPAHSNGADAVPAAPGDGVEETGPASPSPPPAPRRRRTEPLRAR